ncbi:3D domain-containing protein [Shouchella hunanensis]|uniref:3D domain-containing protein n=1 Tax=Shouchella hunanensis TaxID=766894 RepID=A0ABY7W0A7_9BACI|nr:3D domain-containing protein [Shouchella hunanensis]WDF02284.1 3D domain-containing protein [Shouchella hunanensis]
MKKLVTSLAVLGSILVATPAFAYEVKSGDTLSQIANKHQTDVQNIVELNPDIYDKNLIFIGQQLTMPGEGEQSQVKGEIQSNESAPQTASNEPATAESTDSESTSASSETSSSEASNETTETTNSTESASSEPTQSEGTTTMSVEATAYTAFCEGCSGVTATGIDLRANPNQKVIAVDPNVIPLGSKVYVEGYGEAIAGDTGGAINGNKIDLFMPERQDALNFGRQNVTIHVYE